MKPGTEGSTDQTPSASATVSRIRQGRIPSLIWIGLVTMTITTSIVIYIDIAKVLLKDNYHWAVDFIVFWTASGAADPYDFQALSEAQAWYIPPGELRPFAYPPSFLPWIEPFAALPLITAFVLWTAATLVLFVAAWGRVVSLRMTLIAVAAPTVALAAIPGQVVFLVGALLVFGLSVIRKHPIAAGVLFGIAATIKPQTMLLIPIALAASGQWRTLVAAALSGAMIGVLCVAVQGPSVWIDWLESIPRFMAAMHEIGMMKFGITPASALDTAGIRGIPALLLRAAAAAIGVWTVWRLFRSSEDLAAQVLALNAATLLVLPYAMPYELALSAPAAAAMLANRALHPALTLAAFVALTATGEGYAAIIICAAVAGFACHRGDAKEEKEPSVAAPVPG